MRTYSIIIVGLILIMMLVLVILRYTNRELLHTSKIENVVSEVQMGIESMPDIFINNTGPAEYAIDMNNMSEKEIDRLKRWEKEFPWPPTHDPNIEFVPEKYLRLRNDPRIHERTYTDRETLDNHVILRKFYNDDARYSKQFEQLYRILNDNDMAHNPIPAIAIFYAVREYMKAKELNRGKTVEFWQDQIIARLTDQGVWLDYSVAYGDGLRKAERVAQQIVTEMRDMDVLPEGSMSYGISNIAFLYDDSEIGMALVSGNEKLLVPYVGWQEEHAIFHQEKANLIEISIKERDRSFKIANPTMFHPVDIKDNMLVDIDGDPIVINENMTIRGMTVLGIPFPIHVNEDGTARMPTPREFIEAVKQQQNQN